MIGELGPLDADSDWLTVYDRTNRLCSLWWLRPPEVDFASFSARYEGLHDPHLSSPDGAFDVYRASLDCDQIVHVSIALGENGHPLNLHTHFASEALGFPSLFPMADRYLFSYNGPLWIDAAPTAWSGSFPPVRAARRRPARARRD